MGELTLFLGGAKSGKTRRALEEASRYPAPRYYLATAQALDGEMEDRIKNHQAERGSDWRTLEAPLDPMSAIKNLPGSSPILMDCLTLWISNLMGPDSENPGLSFIMDRVGQLAEAISSYKGPVIIVSNEVGGGIVPMNAAARFFRDAAGAANQYLAARAEKVWLVVAGLSLKLK